ncbi:hypothetical protein EG328_008978 [Venturia inaequalis]|uniref:F-box domain-containing protein n=1 Tax=Venturia inaequalis TaxID=5025 RepID=A0A8H3YMU3_VENIN|nr:hypothetical protein EG328_008978 [Venturia inaequalis]
MHSSFHKLTKPGGITTMTLLADLSTELLLHIASFLPQVDLLNISLTSTTLRNATEAELYREWTNILHFDSKRKILPFVRRIIDYPRLARYVQLLETDLWSTLTDWDPEFESEDIDCVLSPEDYEYFANAALSANIIASIREYDHKSNIVARAVAMVDLVDEEPLHHIRGWSNFLYEPNTYIDQVPFDDKFCQSLQAGIEEPLFLLAFTLLNNLREIRLRGAPHSGQRHHLLPLLNPNHCFSELRRLTISAQDGQLEWPLSTFIHQLQSPSLQTLECYCTSEWERDLYGEPWRHRPLVFTVPPRSLSITKVMLQYSALSAAGIKNLLGACRALKSLYFSAGGLKVGPSNFDVFELMEALAPHKTSLETLQLDMNTEWDDLANDAGWIVDLSDFTALKTLAVTSEFLNLDEVKDEKDPIASKSRLCNILPTSLRSLTFQQCWIIDTAEQIEEMIALRPDKFESLGKITVIMNGKYSRPWNGKAMEGHEKTVNVCKEAGVEMIVTMVSDNHEPTFMENWITDRKWYEVRWKDDRYVREQMQPKTTEDLRREGILPQAFFDRLENMERGRDSDEDPWDGVFDDEWETHEEEESEDDEDDEMPDLE